jgi:hypothetical protein
MAGRLSTGTLGVCVSNAMELCHAIVGCTSEDRRRALRNGACRRSRWQDVLSGVVVTASLTSVRTLLIALGLAVSLTGLGCNEEPAQAPERQPPEVVFRKLCNALQYQRQDAILARLGPQTRAALEAMDGDAVTLAAAWVPMAGDIRSLTRRTDELGRVWLQVESVYGVVHEVLAVESESGWTFELSLGTSPPDEPAPGSGAQTPPSQTTDHAPPVVP